MDNNLCTVCPRECKINRSKCNGFCGEGEEIRIARALPHMWEEPCISGEKGSGTVFFSGCPLKCVFCQNAVISRSEKGVVTSVDGLVDTYFKLADMGVCNINLVTPTHFTDGVALSVEKAKAKGLNLPFIWNCGGYEKVETLKRLDGLIDVYLPDFKYVSSRLSKKYSSAENYFDFCINAIKEMKRQQPNDIFENGLIKKGVIIRHLVLPDCTDDSLDVLDEIKKHFGKSQTVSIMSQYTPMGSNLPDSLNRPVSRDEYNKVTSYALLIGLKNGYFQEEGTASESFIPAF